MIRYRTVLEGILEILQCRKIRREDPLGLKILSKQNTKK